MHLFGKKNRANCPFFCRERPPILSEGKYPWGQIRSASTSFVRSIIYLYTGYTMIESLPIQATSNKLLAFPGPLDYVIGQCPAGVCRPADTDGSWPKEALMRGETLAQVPSRTSTPRWHQDAVPGVRGTGDPARRSSVCHGSQAVRSSGPG